MQKGLTPQQKLETRLKEVFPESNVRVQNGQVKMNIPFLDVMDIIILSEIRKDKKHASYHSLLVKRSGTGLVLIFWWEK